MGEPMKPKAARIWLARKRSKAKWSLTSLSEEDERRWGDGGLGHVIDADAAVHGDGRFLEVDLLEEAVHLAGGDALAALAGDEFDLLEEGFDSLARRGGDEDERGVVEVLELVADLLLVEVLVDFGGRGGGGLHRIQIGRAHV